MILPQRDGNHQSGKIWPEIEPDEVGANSRPTPKVGNRAGKSTSAAAANWSAERGLSAPHSPAKRAALRRCKSNNNMPLYGTDCKKMLLGICQPDNQPLQGRNTCGVMEAGWRISKGGQDEKRDSRAGHWPHFGTHLHSLRSSREGGSEAKDQGLGLATR